MLTISSRFRSGRKEEGKKEEATASLESLMDDKEFGLSFPGLQDDKDKRLPGLKKSPKGRGVLLLLPLNPMHHIHSRESIHFSP